MTAKIVLLLIRLLFYAYVAFLGYKLVSVNVGLVRYRPKTARSWLNIIGGILVMLVGLYISVKMVVGLLINRS